MGMSEDLAWFNANRAFIAQQYAGQWVVVSGESVHGAYPTYAAAYDAGVAMLGTVTFLVKQALQQDPTATL